MANFPLLFHVLILASIIVAQPHVAQATISCTTVVSELSPCLSYVEGIGPLTKSCCDGIKMLNSEAATTADRQAACTCLKSLASATSGLKPSLVSGLPGKCGVSVPYPINSSTDCSKVK